MGLFSRKKKSVNKKVDLNHLTPEGELPWGWHYANKEFTQRIQDEYKYFLDAYITGSKNGALDEHAALKALVIYMEDVKKLCASKGECFIEWASVEVANPVALTKHKERLKYLEENMDDLLKHERMIKQLKSELKNTITKEPGVIQSDLYKRYDELLKNHISNELYQMEAHGEIVREKSGRSYKLYIK